MSRKPHNRKKRKEKRRESKEENNGGLGPSFRGCGSLPPSIPRPSLPNPRPQQLRSVRQLPNQRRLHFHPFPHLLCPNFPLHLRHSTSHLHLIIPKSNSDSSSISNFQVHTLCFFCFRLLCLYNLSGWIFVFYEFVGRVVE
uniref:Uncharacterized protein n=1 Tax=Cucumis sativus TaxID=3659 RepID=A0A0A0KYY0_CUCSA